MKIKYADIICEKNDESGIYYIFINDQKEKKIMINYVDSANKDRIINVDDDFCTKLDDEIVFQLIRNIFGNASREGYTPISDSQTVKRYIEKNNEPLLVKDVQPINFDGEISLEDEVTLDVCIELPVRESCRTLNDLGIITLMSSANREDVKRKDEKVQQLTNFQNEHYNIGNGYAWIMIDWQSLSEENKKIIIGLNSGQESIVLSEKDRIRFIHNCEVNNISPNQSELIKFFEVYDFRVLERNRSLIGKLDQTCDEDIYFDANRQGYGCINSLCNHGTDYRTVVLRCPIDEETTIADVNSFFNSIIKKFKKQNKNIDKGLNP